MVTFAILGEFSLSKLFEFKGIFLEEISENLRVGGSIPSLPILSHQLKSAFSASPHPLIYGDLLACLFHFFGATIKGWIKHYFNWFSIALVVLLIGDFLTIRLIKGQGCTPPTSLKNHFTFLHIKA